MCSSCWTKLGRPHIDSPAIRAAAEAIADVYEYSRVGGNLHIVVDDFNVRDLDLDSCAKQIAAGGFVSDVPADGDRQPDSAEQLATEQRCLELLRDLTVEERASAIALHDGFWS